MWSIFLKKVEKDLEFTQENIISKEEQIYNLKLFIEELARNFGDKNYVNVDELLLKVEL